VHPERNRPLETPRAAIRPFQQRRNRSMLTTTSALVAAIEWQRNRNQSQPAVAEPTVARFGVITPCWGLGAALVPAVARAPGSAHPGPQNRPARMRVAVMEPHHPPRGPRRWGVRDHAGSITEPTTFWRSRFGGSPDDVKVRSETIRCSPLGADG